MLRINLHIPPNIKVRVIYPYLLFILLLVVQDSLHFDRIRAVKLNIKANALFWTSFLEKHFVNGKNLFISIINNFQFINQFEIISNHKI